MLMPPPLRKCVMWTLCCYWRDWQSVYNFTSCFGEIAMLQPQRSHIWPCFVGRSTVSVPRDCSCCQTCHLQRLRRRCFLLGMTNCCCQWICDYAAMDSILREATLQCSSHSDRKDKKHKAFKAKSSWDIDGPAYMHRDPPLILHKVTLTWTDDYMTMWSIRLRSY